MPEFNSLEDLKLGNKGPSTRGTNRHRRATTNEATSANPALGKMRDAASVYKRSPQQNKSILKTNLHHSRNVYEAGGTRCVLLPSEETDVEEDKSPDLASKDSKDQMKATSAPSPGGATASQRDEPIKHVRFRLSQAETVPTQAEQMPKARRNATNLARLTAYCICDQFNLTKAGSFLHLAHGARLKMYDAVLHAAYQLPLAIPEDFLGYRVQSRPFTSNIPEQQTGANLQQQSEDGAKETTPSSLDTNNLIESPEVEAELPKDAPQDVSWMYNVADLFIFSYGTVVFWNFTESQERDILADLFFADKGSLMTRPLHSNAFESEEFHFQYSSIAETPRIYNDMITLRSFDPLVKLSMSHALSQSVKLSLFEERMDVSIKDAKVIPHKLAILGKLGMTRDQVFKMSGFLFKIRMDVNLSSYLLDTPDFFWYSEPALHPFYSAIREYLEIRPRVKVLNRRCQLIFDVLDILYDSIAVSKMTRITWIVIYLILVSAVVSAFEVVFRFYILQKVAKSN